MFNGGFMRKLLLPIIISSVLMSSFANAATEEQIKEVIDKNESALFKDQSAKEWGDTPAFIKLLTSKINVRNKNEGLSPFNVIWLKKVNQDPKNYQLSEIDQKWISQKIKEAEDNKSSFWYPNGLTIVVSATPPIVKNEEKPSEEKSFEEKPSDDVKAVDEKESTENADKNAVEATKPVSENKEEAKTPPVASAENSPTDKEIKETKESVSEPVIKEDKKTEEVIKDTPVMKKEKTESPKVIESVKPESKKSDTIALNKDIKNEDVKIESTLPLEKATVSKNKSDFVKSKQAPVIVEESPLAKNGNNIETIKNEPVIIDNTQNKSVSYLMVILQLLGLSFVSALVYSLVSRKKVKNKTIME